MQIDVRLSSTEAIAPTRANPSDAGLDLYVPYGFDFSFQANEKRIVNTNVQVAIPRGYVGLLVARSSLQKKNLMVANNVGIIDAGYRGDLMVVLKNIGNTEEVLVAGERFAQLVLVPIITPAVNLVTPSLEDWNNTDRGEGGFGSTGTN
jgi:dUTP pyrophosphatase